MKGGVVRRDVKKENGRAAWTRVEVVVVRHAARGGGVRDGMSAFNGIKEGALGCEGHYTAV